MAQHQLVFTITEMCRVLQLSCSGYYAWRGRPLSRHAQQDKELSQQIQQLFEESQGRYGSPRIHQELQAQGIQCSLKRVARLMRAQQLVASKPRRLWSTTDSSHTYPVADNLLNREYQVPAVAGVNRAWAGDITYIPTAQGWLYVAVVLDLKSRRVVGWSMGTSLEQTLVSDALEMALKQRVPALKRAVGLLFHCDRGSQYAAAGYQEQLEAAGIVCSMSRRGNCWDNAPVESFFATLKKELVHRENYQTREQATASLFHYIEVFYNRERRHSALGYLSPYDYEMSLLN